MTLHLLLRLEAPLMAFGTVAVDAYRPTDVWPGASLLTGLIGNALGLRRTEPDRLADIQTRLAFACRLDRAGEELRDFHTAQLGAGDRAWTTRGQPEGRAGGANTYDSPHIRYVDYRADASVGVALRLETSAAGITTEEARDALAAPARPLFVGRKACPPAAPILRGETDAPHALAALSALPPSNEGSAPRVLVGDPLVPADSLRDERAVRMADQRRWRSGFHAGQADRKEGVWRGDAT